MTPPILQKQSVFQKTLELSTKPAVCHLLIIQLPGQLAWQPDISERDSVGALRGGHSIEFSFIFHFLYKISRDTL